MLEVLSGLVWRHARRERHRLCLCVLELTSRVETPVDCEDSVKTFEIIVEIELFELESLILAQNERWRQA